MLNLICTRFNTVSLICDAIAFVSLNCAYPYLWLAWELISLTCVMQVLFSWIPDNFCNFALAFYQACTIPKIHRWCKLITILGNITQMIDSWFSMKKVKKWIFNHCTSRTVVLFVLILLYFFMLYSLFPLAQNLFNILDFIQQLCKLEKFQRNECNKAVCMSTALL